MTEAIKNIICSKANYRLSQFVDFIMPIVLFALGIVTAQDNNLGTGFFITGLGYFGWGFLEYTLHRFMYHGNTGIIKYGHTVHHVEPKKKIAMVFFVPLIIQAAMYFGLTPLMGESITLFLTAGFSAGYAYYSFFHVIEHFTIFKSKYYRKLQIHHDLHHVYPDKNYGVTTQFWDTLFSTKVYQ